MELKSLDSQEHSDNGLWVKTVSFLTMNSNHSH